MYHSQWKQDQWLNENVFKNKRNGFFVDIGAHDGETGSNSLFFEEKLGWNGICVEPIPKIFEKLRLRRKCFVVNGCAYDHDGTVQFNCIDGYSEMLSGVNQDYRDEHRNRIAAEMNYFGGTKTLITSESYRLETLFEAYNVKHVDYLSIDTEGTEMNVLRGINFDKVQIDVINAEVNYPQDEQLIDRFLKEKGYKFAIKLGGDVVYTKL